MKITEFDRANIVLLRDLMVSAAQALAKQFGVVAQGYGGKYTSDEYSLTVSFRILGDGGRPAVFDAKAYHLGIKPEVWGRTYLRRGAFGKGLADSYKVVDLKPQNRKYPVIATRASNGKTDKLPIRFLDFAFPVSPAPDSP